MHTHSLIDAQECINDFPRLIRGFGSFNIRPPYPGDPAEIDPFTIH